MMKKGILVVLAISLFIVNFVSAAQCNLDFGINYQLKATQEDNSLKLSKYQSPNFKQDDFLHFWRIYVTNEANCTSEEMILKMNITDPEGNVWDHLFCEYYLKIPSLKSGETYSIVPKGTEIKYLDNNMSFERFYYQDSLGKNFTFCNPSIRYPGLWEVKLFFEPVVWNPDKFVSSWGYSMIDDKNRLVDNLFRVREKSDILNEELQRKTLIFTIVSVFLGILLGYFLSEFKDWKKESKTKKRSIRALIYELEQNLAFVEWLNKNKKDYLEKDKVPFHNIITLNIEKIILGDYINNINLINTLFDYYQSTLIINNFLNRMRSINLPKNITDMKKIFEMLPKYIKKLKNMIAKLKDEK